MNLPYAVWLILSGLIALLVAFLGWHRRTAPGARALTLLMLSLAVWSLTYAVHWLSGTEEARVFWLKMTFFGVVFAPVAFFILVIQFADLDAWLTKKAHAWLILLPVLSLFCLWSDPLHGIFFGDYSPIGKSLIVRGGPWFYVTLVYLYGLICSGIVLLVRAYFRASAFYKRQMLIMLAGAMLPWLVNFLILMGWTPQPGLDLTPLAFTGTGLIFAYGFFGYRMMDLTPVGRNVLVENMDEAIVVVDTGGRIVDINPMAMQYAESGLNQPFGRQFKDVFSRWADIFPKYAALEGRAEFKLERPPFSFFELKIISLKDRHGIVVGKLITWRDITARKQAEENLRIFFHTVEQNPVAIMITDPKGLIEYVNPHFVYLTGYVLKEVHGKSPKILRSGETTDSQYEDMWETILSGLVWEGEILNRSKNGELFWAHELIAPVLDEAGMVTHFVSMQQNITDSKRAEAELRIVNTRLQMQLTEIEALHDQLREDAIRDGLTRLFNRSYMEETLDREISRAERGPRPISVVMMDVDFFKTINDIHGHQAGDVVLQTLGVMLLENTRISDIACRYGGDEMLVVMPDATQDVAVARAEEWRKTFSLMEFTFGEKMVTTTLSLGVASFPEQAQNPIELLTAADKALYLAKTQRNQVQCYDPSTMARSLNFSDDIR